MLRSGPVAVQHTEFSRWVVPVEAGNGGVETGLWKLRQRSALSSGRVADVEGIFTGIGVGDEEEAITGGLDLGPVRGGAGAEDRPKLAIAANTKGDETVIDSPFLYVVALGAPAVRILRKYVDERERRLTTMVREHEVVGGGGTAPRLADGAAAEDGSRTSISSTRIDSGRSSSMVAPLLSGMVPIN